MKTSRSNRHGLFKLDMLFKVNLEQSSIEGEYVGFKPISGWIISQEITSFVSYYGVRTKTDTGR